MASRSSKNNSFRRQNCNFKGASHFFVRFFAFFDVKLPKCYILSYVQTDATTSKIVGPTMLGLLRPFERSSKHLTGFKH